MNRFLPAIKSYLILSFPFFLCSCASVPTKKVCFDNVCVYSEIADSDFKRTQGLMFREYMKENRAMLFVFDQEDRYSFWMKNMRFPLDIIWISEDKRVAQIRTDVKPCVSSGICESLMPSKRAKYALEVNAGFVNRHEIKIGGEVKFSLTK